MTKRVDLIKEVLDDVYGKSFMTPNLAGEINDRWDTYGEQRSFQDELTVHIWYWYSGGDTAAYAAKRIIEAVGDTK